VVAKESTSACRLVDGDAMADGWDVMRVRQRLDGVDVHIELLLDAGAQIVGRAERAAAERLEFVEQRCHIVQLGLRDHDLALRLRNLKPAQRVLAAFEAVPRRIGIHVEQGAMELESSRQDRSLVQGPQSRSLVERHRLDLHRAGSVHHLHDFAELQPLHHAPPVRRARGGAFCAPGSSRARHMGRPAGGEHARRVGNQCSLSIRRDAR
jgi:hypothetical protein